MQAVMQFDCNVQCLIQTVERWQMHEMLFTHSQALGNGYLVEYANDLGLDIARFLQDLLKQVHGDRINQRYRKWTTQWRNGCTSVVYQWYSVSRSLEQKGTAWAEQGCDVALADMNDTDALKAAFADAEGVFVLLPPNFAPSQGFPETRAIVAALRTALLAARPDKVVCLSTIGAQATQLNLLTQLQIMEQELGDLPLPIAFLRPAWFMENAAWDVADAREQGIIPSFLQPLDKPVPMIAIADVGRSAAELLQQT